MICDVRVVRVNAQPTGTVISRRGERRGDGPTGCVGEPAGVAAPGNQQHGDTD